MTVPPLAREIRTQVTFIIEFIGVHRRSSAAELNFYAFAQPV
jgi:hypothetical protein